MNGTALENESRVFNFLYFLPFSSSIQFNPADIVHAVCIVYTSKKNQLLCRNSGEADAGVDLEFLQACTVQSIEVGSDCRA